MYECGTTCVMYFTRDYFLVLKYMFSFGCLDRVLHNPGVKCMFKVCNFQVSPIHPPSVRFSILLLM